MVVTDGRVNGKHFNNNVEELFELLLCKITEPALKYATGLNEPFYVVKQLSQTLSIDLEPYVLTNDASCGSLVYSKSVQLGSVYDPFA